MAENKPLRQDVEESYGNLFDEDIEISEYVGFRLPVHFRADNVRYAMEQWKWPTNPIFIASYPKCGTTWTMEIVRQILYGRDEKLSTIDADLKSPIHMIEIGVPTKKWDLYERIPLPRKYFTTHIREELFNFEKLRKANGKVIYVTRNPKDQLVSWFKFTKIFYVNEKLRKRLFSEKWDDFFEEHLRGEHDLYTNASEKWPFPGHVKGWLKHKDDENVLVLVFEDMKRDLTKEVKRISEFLEVSLSDDDIQCVVESTTLKKMAARAEKLGMKNRVKTGEVGGWKNYFTEAQSERMDKMIEESFKETGIEFCYQL